MYTMYAYTEPQPFRIKTVKPARHPQQPHFSSNLGSPKFRLKPPNHNSLSLSLSCSVVPGKSEPLIPGPYHRDLKNKFPPSKSFSLLLSVVIIFCDLNELFGNFWSEYLSNKNKKKKKKKIYLLNFQILSTLEKWVVLSLGVLGFVKFIFIGIWGFWNSGCEFLLSNNGARITKEEAWWDGPRALERTDYVC